MDELTELLEFEKEYESKKEESRQPFLQTYLKAMKERVNDTRFKLLKEYLGEFDLDGLMKDNDHTWSVETSYGRPDCETVIPIPKDLGLVLDALFGKDHPVEWEQKENADYGDSLVFHLEPKKKKKRKISTD